MEKPFEPVKYHKRYEPLLIAFLEQCLPESGRALDINGRHSFYKDIENCFKAFWCMFDQEKVIGAVAVKELDDVSCELKSLYLLEQYHGRGYGKSLLNKAIAYAKESGYEKMYLDSLSTSKKAIVLYSKTGFVETEKYNQNERSDVFMVLDLKSKKKAIFWDSDGTLLYGNESFKTSLIRAFEKFRYSLEEDVARNFMRGVCSWYVPEKNHSDKDGEEWWKDLLGEISMFCERQGVRRSDIASICDSFRENVITFEYEAYPDAKAALTYFREKGYENYIISNNFPELGKVFERLGLDTEISGYFLSAGVGYEKPRKEIYEYSKSTAGNPEICYMIGDNPVTDYRGGMEAGMTPILVHNMEVGKVCCEQLTDLFDLVEG